ncbi:hypothetical protein CERSUDRAFT_114049 [Gelatoporia subvermispora B]|uniref:Uncharacterized protein n=1 Tax=Ceriporiopsis subvermispora (strain B) TaxID=914234 RepID=M2REY4_CERS8|nr:hypothetical protein CERSUDRAFT_114049 [Gelatoporia subvermispora B]
MPFLAAFARLGRVVPLDRMHGAPACMEGPLLLALDYSHFSKSFVRSVAAGVLRRPVFPRWLLPCVLLCQASTAFSASEGVDVGGHRQAGSVCSLQPILRICSEPHRRSSAQLRLQRHAAPALSATICAHIHGIVARYLPRPSLCPSRGSVYSPLVDRAVLSRSPTIAGMPS